MPLAARNDIRIVDGGTSMSDVIALGKFDIRILSQHSQNGFSLLFIHGEDADIGAGKGALMESTAGVNTARELSLRKVSLRLGKNPTGHKPLFLGRCGEGEKEATKHQKRPAHGIACHTRVRGAGTA